MREYIGKRKNMEWLSITVNGTLALIALWYTLETRKLRIQNQVQLELLAKQARLSLAPYLHVSLLNLESTLLIFGDEGKIPKTEDEKLKLTNALRERFSKPNLKFICKISNKSTKLATTIRVYVFDCKARTFFRSAWGRTVLSEKETDDLEISNDAVSLDVIKQELQDKYGESNNFFNQQLTTDCPSSYTIVFYKDIEGNPYAVKREYEIDSGRIITEKRNTMLLPEIRGH
jgi:hypothetical protein